MYLTYYVYLEGIKKRILFKFRHVSVAATTTIFREDNAKRELCHKPALCWTSREMNLFVHDKTEIFELCITLDPSVDNNMRDTHGTRNIVKFIWTRFTRRRSVPEISSEPQNTLQTVTVALLACQTHLRKEATATERYRVYINILNPLNAELNPIRHLLALVGDRHIVHVSRIRVKSHPPFASIGRRPPYCSR